MIIPFMTTNYKNLNYLVGRELELVNEDICEYRKPEKCVFIADYPLTVMIERTYIKSEWGQTYAAPRKIRTMLPKSKLAVGDITLKVKDLGIYLVGKKITEYDMSVVPLRDK